jgi:hypothetical protein
VTFCLPTPARHGPCCMATARPTMVGNERSSGLNRYDIVAEEDVREGLLKTQRISNLGTM